MLVLALDISMVSTGWSIFSDEKLQEYGVIKETRYKGYANHRYPVRTAKVGKFMTDDIVRLILEKQPDRIVIEEVSIGGLAGVKSVKGLIQVHGMLMYFLEVHGLLEKVTLIPPQGKDGWRTYLNVKKNGDWKATAVKKVNHDFLMVNKLTEDQHDVAESILLGHCFVLKWKSGDYEEKKK